MDWKLNVPPKVRNFLWKACNDGIPSKSHLERSHVFTPQECVFCNFHSESTTHLCFLSPFTIDTFALLHQYHGWPDFPAHLFSNASSPFLDPLSQCHSSLSPSSLERFAIGWWFIWFFRNNIIFRSEATSHRQAAESISKFASSWFNSSGSDGPSGCQPLSFLKGDS